VKRAADGGGAAAPAAKKSKTLPRFRKDQMVMVRRLSESVWRWFPAVVIDVETREDLGVTNTVYEVCAVRSVVRCV